MNKLLVIAVLVVLLAFNAESFRVPRQTAEEEEGTLTKITGTIKSYYDYSVDTASGYLEDIKGLKLEEKAMNLYDETTKAVGTYAGIIQDQIYYLFYPQQ
ncbi:apolipoprotein C-II [Polymixia lowei]